MSACSSCSSSSPATAYAQEALQSRTDSNQARSVSQSQNQDDSSGAANALKPTVNNQGESLGRVINTAA